MPTQFRVGCVLCSVCTQFEIQHTTVGSQSTQYPFAVLCIVLMDRIETNVWIYRMSICALARASLLRTKCVKFEQNQFYIACTQRTCIYIVCLQASSVSGRKFLWMRKSSSPLYTIKWKLNYDFRGKFAKGISINSYIPSPSPHTHTLRM